LAETRIRTGGCLCGAVRYEVRGPPIKAGVCHCTDCRKATGTAFLAYADWEPKNFAYQGAIRTFDGRSFCPECGSRLFNISTDQAEIYLGTLDEAPSDIAPIVEAWVVRREPWLKPLAGRPQFRGDPA
jgi:hypothetical protein